MTDPLLPFSLPQPAVVHQQSRVTCWAACFRSLTQTDRSSLRFSETDLMRIFNAFLGSGGISGPGVVTLGHTMNMTVVSARGSHFSLPRVRRGLVERGYVIIAFIFPGQVGVGHVVIAYGVTAQGVQVMNPDPTGPSFLNTTYLQSSPCVMTLTPIWPSIAVFGNPATLFR